MTPAAYAGLHRLQRMPTMTDAEMRQLMATPEFAAALSYCRKALEHWESPRNQARLQALRDYKHAHAPKTRRRYRKGHPDMIED